MVVTEEVLALRTRYLALVVEDLYQPHNAAAVMRAAECFGVQDLHVISSSNRFRSREETEAGAARWLTRHHYDGDGATRTCLQALKQRGYRIWATTLRPGAVPLEQLPLTEKVALCFGTEERGLSDEAHALADGFVYLPMYGFTQSFNISVSVALALFQLTERLRTGPCDWQLSGAEQEELRRHWREVLAAEPRSGA